MLRSENDVVRQRRARRPSQSSTQPGWTDTPIPTVRPPSNVGCTLAASRALLVVGAPQMGPSSARSIVPVSSLWAGDLSWHARRGEVDSYTAAGRSITARMDEHLVEGRPTDAAAAPPLSS
jgi:hypothetical protein